MDTDDTYDPAARQKVEIKSTGCRALRDKPDNERQLRGEIS